MNTLLLETSVKKLNSPKSYDKFISQFPSVNSNKIKLGRMYSYDYDFYKFYSPDVIKFFDKRPLVIFVSKWQSKNLVLGLNFHFFPVLLRANFLSKLRSRNTTQFSKSGFNTVKISYSLIKQIIFKAKNCVRWYRPEAMSNIHEIPNREWVNATQYQISSFYKVDINQIVNRYKGYENRPKQQKAELKESLGFDFESFTSNENTFQLLENNLINPYPIF